MLACFRQNKKDGALLKLDFAKVYGMLDWNFIIEVLHIRGFGSRWIRWITNILRGKNLRFY